MRFTDKAYNGGKTLVQIILPGLGAIYFLLSLFVELPATKNVIGLLAVYAFFVGLLLSISTTRYKASGAEYDGQLYVVVPEDGPKVFTLELNGDPEELAQQEAVTFKILPERSQ